MTPIIKAVFLPLSFVAFSQAAFAQNGIVELDDSVHSEILNKNVKYSVYLPAAWAQKDSVLPVVYLLHGLGGGDRDYLQGFRLGNKMDSCIAIGALPPAAIICPEGYRTFYTNDVAGKFRYEDFFIQEFIPLIEKKYGVGGKKEKRSLAGLSMGGYGALKIAMKYPDAFQAASGMSAAIRSDSAMLALTSVEWKDRGFDQIYSVANSDNRLTPAWYENSVLYLAQTMPAESLQKVRYWIDCGDDDYLDDGNYELHKILKKRKIYHEYRVRNGGHEWMYWDTGIIPALKFALKK